jgi:hypothetical protein
MEGSPEVEVDVSTPTSAGGAGLMGCVVSGAAELVAGVEALPDVEATLDVEAAPDKAALDGAALTGGALAEREPDVEAALAVTLLRSVEGLGIGASSDVDAGKDAGATLDVEAGGGVDWEVSSLGGPD